MPLCPLVHDNCVGMSVVELACIGSKPAVYVYFLFCSLNGRLHQLKYFLLAHTYYISLYICMCVCKYIHTYICKYVCMYVCT